MGGGSFDRTSFQVYSTSVGKSYDSSSGRVSHQTFKAKTLKQVMNPKDVIRECANTDEHPNTIPVILGLDVTGSMGHACIETASALGVIMTNLYDKFKDIEFCIMGIGDFECDDYPLQVSQFESDIRIAQSIDNIYMEHGGGGNGYESYSAAWLFGLYRTKLDAFEQQGRKGIIITMGDEPLNPCLEKGEVERVLGSFECILRTDDLYRKAKEKFDIFHISITDTSTYRELSSKIESSFKLLGENYKSCSVNELAHTITECINQSLQHQTVIPSEFNTDKTDSDGGIVW